MKIALLHYSAPPVVGGVESVLAHHARLLQAAGHAVTIVAGRGDPPSDESRFVRLPLIDSRHAEVLALKAELDAGRVPAGFDAAARRIEAALRPVLEWQDAVILHNVCSLHKNLALTAALHALNRDAPAGRFLLWHHDLAWSTPRYRAELHAGHPWDLLRQPWPGARQIVVSETRRRELADLMGLAPETIAVVPNGVEAAHLLKLEPLTVALAEAMGLAQADPLLLLPVRLTPRKNIELALEALAALRRGYGQGRAAYPDAGLVITGPEGPHNPANAEYRRRLIEQRDRLGLARAAHFAAEYANEFLPDEVVADFYRLADALILPSREEGFGIPVLEAAFARLPVFCADIETLREVGGQEAVYFSPEAAPEAVAALIAEHLAADRRYRLAARARRRYRWDQIYARNIAPLLEPS